MIDPLDQFDLIDNDFMLNNAGLYGPLVGEYVISFSYFEYGINVLVADLINERSHEMGYLITAKMSMYDKIDLLARLGATGKFHGVPRLKKVLPLIPKLRAANTFRNRIAHALWITMKPSGVVRVKTKVDGRNGVFFQNVNLSARVIKAEVTKLKKLTEQVYDFHI